MQQILLNIDNKELEEKLVEEAKKKGRKLASLIIDVLEKNFIKSSPPEFHFKKLNPLKHMSKPEVFIDEDEGDENDDAVSPFSDITDSASYVRQLREKGWR